MRSLHSLKACGLALAGLILALDPATAASAPTAAKAAAAEKRSDFSSPPIRDAELKVSGLPEAVKWYTSRPGIWGSARAREGGSFKAVIPAFPATFRSVGPKADAASRRLFANGLALLETNGETGEWMPGLATHWAFGSDGKTVYYKLNEKARWSDGEPVTSHDFVFALDMLRSPRLQDPWYNEYYRSRIASVKGLGKYLVAVSLPDRASDADLVLLTNLSPRPSHFYEGEIGPKWAEAYDREAEPTTGPYCLRSYVEGESLVFGRVKGWWGYAYPYNRYRFNFDTVEYRVLKEGETEEAAFLDGSSYQLDADAAARAEAVRSSPGFKAGRIRICSAPLVPRVGISGIFLNTKDPLFADPELRRALYYAIDMEGLAAARGEGWTRLHNIGLGHRLAGLDFDDASLRKPAFDGVKAGELFALSGFTATGPDGIRAKASGERLSFELLCADERTAMSLAPLAAQAKKAGLELKPVACEGDFFGRLAGREFSAAWTRLETGNYDDYRPFFHSEAAARRGSLDFWAWSSPAMDGLLEAFGAELDGAKKAEASRRIQALVDREALVIPGICRAAKRVAAWSFVLYPDWLSTKLSPDFSEVLSSDSGYGAFWGYQWFESATQGK